MDLFKLLLEPQVLSILGPLGAIAVVEAFAIRHLFNLYSASQEKRIEDAKELSSDYNALVHDINLTLDTLTSLLSKGDK